jgi:hypothetical protein
MFTTKLSFRLILAAIVMVALLCSGLANIQEHLGLTAALGTAALLYSLAGPMPSQVLGVAATASRNTDTRPGNSISLPLAAATKIFKGTLVARDAAGRAVPASDTAGLRVVGMAAEDVDNSAGLADALSITIELGIFQFENSATNAVDPDDIGKMAVVEDDNTVAETSTNRVCAGRIIEVSTAAVWVDTRYAFFGPRTLVTLTSADGVAAAASANLAGLAAEAEKIGDDVRALHASLFG